MGPIGVDRGASLAGVNGLLLARKTIILARVKLIFSDARIDFEGAYDKVLAILRKDPDVGKTVDDPSNGLMSTLIQITLVNAIRDELIRAERKPAVGIEREKQPLKPEPGGLSNFFTRMGRGIAKRWNGNGQGDVLGTEL